MRITALSALAVILLLPGPAFGKAAEPETPYTRIAKLATYISAGDTVGALEAFDKSLPSYGTISQDLAGLSAQTDVLCAIDVVEDKEADDAASDVHHLTLDWYMTLTSREDAGLTERRRVEVAVTMKRFRVESGRKSRDVWRITALSPEKILAPITIR